jgi:hypothetical protein
MRRIVPVVILVGGLALGCMTTDSRSVGSLAFPHEGTHCVYASNGRLLQRTNWRAGALVAAWEYEQPGDLPLELITAVHRGQREYPPPRWVQTVISGKGRIHTFGERGEIIGSEDYFTGAFWRGRH